MQSTLPPDGPARRRVQVEVCVSSLEDAVAAVAAGADRLELCAALEVGGLTPSIGLLREVLAAVDKPVLAMIRPRTGDFTLSDGDFRTALADVHAAVAEGVAGVVFGVLDASRKVDVHRSRILVEAASGAETVFHRAIDFTDDPAAGVERLREIGVTRVLTSGGARRAIDGVATIQKMRNRSAGTVQILPGGGVRADHVSRLIEAAECDQIHLGPSRRSCYASLGGGDVPGLVDLETLSANCHRTLDAQAVEAVLLRLQGSGG